MDINAELGRLSDQLVKQGMSRAAATAEAGRQIEAYMVRTQQVTVGPNGTATRRSAPVSNNAGDPGSSVRHVGYTSSHTKPT